jgi:hypothetical protein
MNAKEHAELRKEMEELRSASIVDFLIIWDLLIEKRLLWEGLEGLACDLFVLWNPLKRTVVSYVTKQEKGKTRIADLGVRKLRRRERKCSI